jgi:hypothetical protein
MKPLPPRHRRQLNPFFLARLILALRGGKPGCVGKNLKYLLTAYTCPVKLTTLHATLGATWHKIEN